MDAPNGYINGHDGLNGEVGYELAPGAERHHATNGTNGLAPTPPESIAAVSTFAPKIMDYSVDFPQLPSAQTAGKPLAGAWGSVKSTTVTAKVTFQPYERAIRIDKRSNEMTEEQQKCASISKLTGVKIELSESRDQSLTILITGKPKAVEDARTMLMKELQTQAQREYVVPQEYRGKIIGKERSKIKEIESLFSVKIFMPNKNDANDALKITGPPEFVHKAVKFIENKINEFSNVATESLPIPRSYYQWIRGPANENVDRWFSQYNVKVNIPPSSAGNEIIVVNGGRDNVPKVAEEVRKIYQTNKDAASITCKVPKTQHRYVLGARRSGLDEILRCTGVVVDVPGEKEDSDVLTLRGNTARLADALSIVYAKATSTITRELKYLDWQKRHLLGPKGAKLHELIPKQDKLRVDFDENLPVVFLEGTPEAVNVAAEALQKEIDRLTKEMNSEVVKVPESLHRHITGKNRASLIKIRQDYDVQTTLPEESKGVDEIRVDGKKEAVKKAVIAIKEFFTRLENEKTRDIIIEQRFHGMLIGKNGEGIKKWRHEYPTVSISFPVHVNKSDIVNLRGDKKEVDLLAATMLKMHKELLESNYQETVPIFKEYYKHIIGKNGANINKIREETNTRIESPTEGSPDGRLTVIGKPANVEKAIEKLNKIQNELASIVAVDVEISNKLHSRLLAYGRRLIRDIEDEFGGVHILFPKEKNSDKVIIRGPKDDVAKAEKALKEVAKHTEETTEEASIPVPADYIKFLIGRDGSNIKRMRESYPSVRIIFSETGAEQKIILLGKKDEVEAVKKAYAKQIQELEETVEIAVEIDPKYHKHFVVKSGIVVNEVREQNGGVNISFPKQESGDNKVIIKGSKQCVESAKQRLEEIVEDLEKQVTIHMTIPNEHHRAIVPHANDLRTKYNVKIHIPSKKPDGEKTENDSAHDIITISGRDTKVEEAKQALMELIPISRTINVPIDLHKILIGKSGEVVKDIMTKYAVRIHIPRPQENSEKIIVTGAPANVESCFEYINGRIPEYEAQAEEHKLKSYKTTIAVPIKYHRRLLGPRGAAVLEMQTRHGGVHVKIPKSDAPSEIIEIEGFEEKANACRKEIEDIVAELDKMFHKEIDLDPRFHPRLIGQSGRNLKKIEHEFKVEIKTPGKDNTTTPSLVVVSGKEESDVVDCCEKLKRMEDEYVEGLIERGHVNVRQQLAPEPPVQNQQVQFHNAPWQMDADQFPAMGGESAGQCDKSNSGVWGNRRW